MSKVLPRVSVIMIFLNAERFMEEAIESVLAQTLTAWELILIDDGSNDASPRIAARYAEQFPGRVRMLQHPDGKNHGTAASRNLGFREARGEYIALLDADDVYAPGRLAAHVACLDRDPEVGVVLGPDHYWRRWAPCARKREAHYDQIIALGVETGRRFEPPALIASILLTRGAPMPASCSITFRTEAVRRLGGIPEEFRKHYEDQVLICKLLLSAAAVVLDEPLARYRQHEASVTRGNSPLEAREGSPAVAARGRFLNWLKAYLSELDFDLPALRSWIDAELSMLASPSRPEKTMKSRTRALALRIADRVLPEPLATRLARLRQRLDVRRVGRRVMWRIGQIEAQLRQRQSGLDMQGKIRVYWNARVDDTRLSDDSPGSAAFYAAHDTYRLEKSDYLLRVIDFDAWTGHDVLEIGCGAGLDLVRFALGGARVTGVDVAATAVDLARDYCRVAGVEARLIEADGAHLPLPTNSFDLVYCMGVLPFARDPAAIVAEAHRVLRPDGQALFMVYNRRSWMNLLARFRGGLGGHSDAPVFHLYDSVEFERLLEPFPERRLQAERLPRASDRHSGVAGAIFDRGLVPALRALPDGWLKPYGWHLLAFCRKQA